MTITSYGYSRSVLGVHYFFLNWQGRGYVGRGKSSGQALMQALSIATNCGEK